MKAVRDGQHLENAQRMLNIWLVLQTFLATVGGVVRHVRIATDECFPRNLYANAFQVFLDWYDPFLWIVILCFIMMVLARLSECSRVMATTLIGRLVNCVVKPKLPVVVGIHHFLLGYL